MIEILREEDGPPVMVTPSASEAFFWLRFGYLAQTECEACSKKMDKIIAAHHAIPIKRGTK